MAVVMKYRFVSTILTSNKNTSHPVGREVPLVVPPGFARTRASLRIQVFGLYPGPVTEACRHTLLCFGLQLRNHVHHRAPTGSHPTRLALSSTAATPVPSSLAAHCSRVVLECQRHSCRIPVIAPRMPSGVLAAWRATQPSTGRLDGGRSRGESNPASPSLPSRPQKTAHPAGTTPPGPDAGAATLPPPPAVPACIARRSAPAAAGQSWPAPESPHRRRTAAC